MNTIKRETLYSYPEDLKFVPNKNGWISIENRLPLPYITVQLLIALYPDKDEGPDGELYHTLGKRSSTEDKTTYIVDGVFSFDLGKVVYWKPKEDVSFEVQD